MLVTIGSALTRNAHAGLVHPAGFSHPKTVERRSATTWAGESH